MNLPERPKLRGDVIVRQVEDDFVVYDPVTDRTALLNPSAAVLLGLCDGSRTIDEIARTVADAYPDDPGDVMRSVEASFEELAGSELFESSGCRRPTPRRR